MQLSRLYQMCLSPCRSLLHMLRMIHRAFLVRMVNGSLLIRPCTIMMLPLNLTHPYP